MTYSKALARLKMKQTSYSRRDFMMMLLKYMKKLSTSSIKVALVHSSITRKNSSTKKPQFTVTWLLVPSKVNILRKRLNTTPK